MRPNSDGLIKCLQPSPRDTTVNFNIVPEAASADTVRLPRTAL
jgi:hypothetical protein